MKKLITIEELKEDFLNVDSTRAISAEGSIFNVGDTVCHEGSKIKHETAIIIDFSLNTTTLDVIAKTTKGDARISFLYFPET